MAYPKDARRSGRSGWTLRKKLKLALDSLTGFDHALVRGMSYLGFMVALAGFALAIYVVVHAVGGEAPTGWSSMMIAILLLGGVQMIFLGVLGEYAWRTLDEARGRPLYVVETRPTASSLSLRGAILRMRHFLWMAAQWVLAPRYGAMLRRMVRENGLARGWTLARRWMRTARSALPGREP